MKNKIPTSPLFLGAKKSRKVIFSTLLLVITSFFYCFVIGSFFAFHTYILLHRVTYDRIFSVVITTLEIDSYVVIVCSILFLYLSVKEFWKKTVPIVVFLAIIGASFFGIPEISIYGALFTIPVITAIILADRFSRNRACDFDLHLISDFVAIGALILAATGVVSLALYLAINASAESVEKYSYAVYQQLLSIVAPILVAVLVFSVPFKVVLTRLINRAQNLENLVPTDHLGSKRIAVYLMLCISLGIAITLIPHLHVANPNNERLGVDTPRYVLWMTQLKNQSSNPIALVFSDIGSGDRSLTLVILFLFTQSSNLDPYQVAEYSPVLLSPLLILITFFLTRELTHNDKISIISAFLSTFSFQVLIGIYSGFYANWLSLIMGYIAFTLIIRYLNRGSKYLIVLILLSVIACLLAHTYTWTVIIAIAFIFLIVLHLTKHYKKERFLILYLVLFSSVLVDVTKSVLIGSPIGFESDLNVSTSHGFALSQFSERLGTLSDIVQTYYGGVLSNFIILGVATYWLIRCRMKEISSIFILIFLSSAVIPLFLGDWVLQSRTLYDIPFQIPAAIGLYLLFKENHRVLTLAFLLIAFYLSLHILVNLGFVPAISKAPLSTLLDK